MPIVECQCECGNVKKASLWDVRSGKTKTCGLNHPYYEDRSIPAFNNLYNNAYKLRAIKNGWEFDLTKEQFKELTQKPCHYCGCEPSGCVMYRKRRNGEILSKYIYNGLDRMDTHKGYVLNNVVSCCGICNHAKHTMSYTGFITWIDRLCKFRQNQGSSSLET